MTVTNAAGLEFEGFREWFDVLAHVRAEGCLYYPVRKDRKKPTRLRAMASGDRVRLSPLPGLGDPFWITSEALGDCHRVKR